MTSRRSPTCFSLLGLVLWLAPNPSAAQLAPTGGHYAGRASDTGFAAGADPSGGYATSVPLDLPAVRGDLPIPLAIGSGARGFGTAGVGWDVPLSYVQRDAFFAHRRPAMRSDAAPLPRERVILSLLGRRLEMVRKGSDWVSRFGSAELTMRETGSSWKVFDGEGRTYTFTADPRLSGTGLWLLDSIKGRGGSELVVNYHIDLPFLPGAASPSITIDITRVSYNRHPTAGCFKNEINLFYDGIETAPLSLSVIGERVIARLHALTGVEVNSRGSCDGARERLRSYRLSYEVDPDTKQRRLSSVKMYGRSGTPEASSNIPVASYAYGTATHSAANGPVLRYQKTQSIAMPPGADTSMIANTAGVGVNLFNLPWRYITVQSLTDVTGDGRPDLIFLQNNTLMVGRNLPGVSGTTTLGVATAPLWDTTLTGGPLELRSASDLRFEHGGDAKIGYVWRQAIDVNGDGRVDLIDAQEKADHWVVYLNTPDPGLSGIKWVRRSYLISPLYQRFRDRNLKLPAGGYLPLSRRFTANIRVEYRCWLCEDGGWSTYSDLRVCWGDVSPEIGPERTYTEWEVKDVNGDGYPDVVFNSSPIAQVEIIGGPPTYYTCGPNDGFYTPGDETYTPQPVDPHNRIEAVFNVRGLFMTDGASGPDYYPFSSPVWLKSETLCGVGKWAQEANPLVDRQSVVCDLVDVNGDGLLDRVEDLTVFLGTGSGFDAALITLPAQLAAQSSGQPACGSTASSTTFFDSRQTAALRDLTGDGIPDLIKQTGKTWRVHVGTGAGFSAPIDIDGPFILSQERENCSGTISNTTGGLYDIDGDGKPETVELNGSNLDVYQLAGGSTARTPEGGKVVRVDNGFGAATTIAYRSAKENGTALHQVPFPEIVVSSVETTGTLGLGGSLSSTRYAYGGAEMFYDPRSDAFTFPGYQRTVHLRSVGEPGMVRAPSLAMITDTYALTPWAPSMTPNERFGRYLRAGRVRDTTKLGGDLGTDPWPLLSTNVGSDARRIGGEHFEWDTRSFVESYPPSSDFCMELMYPYDFDASVSNWFANNNYDVCATHGFMFGSSMSSWRGSSAPPSAANVQTRTEVRKVDDLGRVLSIFSQNDLFRGDDDVCVDTVYATPSGSNEHVLSAPTSQRVWNCGPEGGNATYAMDTWVYDNLPPGSVGSGLVTTHIIEPHAADNGASFPSFKEFDAIYDAAGNPRRILRVREDGASLVTTLDYEPFGLAIQRVAANATNTPLLEVSSSLDPISLKVLSTKDANGTENGAVFDGFGRPVLATVRPPGGVVGALRSLRYVGFGGGDPLGRRMIAKDFTDPVAPSTVGNANGRISTTFLDELGRGRQTRIALGSDYGNETMIAGARVYDGLGRVFFEADPYPASEDATTAYGTTRFFNTDGTPRVFVRGPGQMPLTTVPDPTTERYPTYFRHSFANHMESLSVQDAASLTAGSPQDGVIEDNILSALGRSLFRSTWRNGVRLEHESFTQDRLGNVTSMARYQNAPNGTNAVQWSWRFDSLGRLLEVFEPTVAPQTRRYSNWGELLQVRWTPPAPDPPHDVIYRYDALGRMVYSEEQTGGVADPATVTKFGYDVGKSFPQVDPTHVLGRMTSASAPTGDVFFSYDGFGRVNARTHTDPKGDWYVEQHTFHGDGSPAAMELDLPDNGHQPERVTYSYDSAGRPRSMLYSDGTSSKLLFKAQAVDPFGRLRKATFASTAFTANWAETGRRLLKDASVTSGQGTRGLTMGSYDPLGRELSRSENSATGQQVTDVAFDELGRLSSSVKADSGTTLASWGFSYDPLGNVLGLNDALGTADAALSYRATDRDQICRVGYGNGGLGGAACNVDHDIFGNVVTEPTRTSYRKLKYLNSGAVRSIEDPAVGTAELRYGALGGVQELDIYGGTEKRLDRRYGSFIVRRDHSAGSAHASFLSRQFPGPGIVVSRRGPTGPWIFTFGESSGRRFTTDENGAFVQEFDYEPYGEAKSSGAQPGSKVYSTEQWNDGDALTPFGLVNLGARVYDPVIGRFLSRDPLLIPRSAATTNPYAFAMNDPRNGSDPTGLDEGTHTSPYPPFDFSRPPPLLSDAEIEHRRRELERMDARITNEPQTDAGRAWKGVMEVATGLHEAGDWWDDIGRSCKTYDCVNGALQNTPLSAEDRAFNAWADDKWAMRKQILFMTLTAELSLIFPKAAFVLGMSQARNENEIVLPLLGYGFSQVKAPQTCPGGVCATDATCFTAGTQIATDSGLTPIETLEPGDRVHSLDDSRCTEPIDRASCQVVEIEMENPYGYPDRLAARFLKSDEWVAGQGLASGTEVPLEIEELQIHGRARVTGIGRCTIQPGPGCLVTGTVTHLNRSVLRVHFVGSAETLEPTALHPLWSVDRDRWIQAGELGVGEHLLTKTGTVTVASIDRLEGAHPVFNFEVAGAHTYVVSGLQIKAHNQCPQLTPKTPLPKELQGGRLTDVYVGKKPSLPRVYAGISVDVGKRQRQHGLGRFYLEHLTLEPVPRGAARAIEEALIVRNQALNKIHSISPRHSFYPASVAWGEEWLQLNGFKP